MCSFFFQKLGSVVHDKCSTEMTTLTNYTNTMSISLLNSTVDKDRFRSGVIGLLLSEMANTSSSTQMNTPTGSYVAQQQPIIIVQPPAQQIYFNQPSSSSYDRDYSYDTTRAERNAQSKYLLSQIEPNFVTNFHLKNFNLCLNVPKILFILLLHSFMFLS